MRIIERLTEQASRAKLPHELSAPGKSHQNKQLDAPPT